MQPQKLRSIPQTIANKPMLVAKDYKQKYYNNPNRWIFDILGVHLWSKQREIVDAVFNGEKTKTVVPSCHSAGKTFVAACIVLAYLYIRTPCKIITSAPTGFQVRDLLWSEINHLYNTRLRDKGFPPGECMISRIKVREDWFALGISPRDAVNFQGYHQRHVLVVLDEAPGVRRDIIQGAETLESSGDVKVLKIGNPDESSGDFYESYLSPNYNKIKISAFDTPNFTGEKVPVSIARELTSKAWVEERRKKWGETSPLWMSKVLGEFPEVSGNKIISLSLCERAKERWHDMVVEKSPLDTVGVDVAWYGGDLSTIIRRSGLKITGIKSVANMDPVEVAEEVEYEYKQNPFKIANVDRIGMGGGTIGALKKMGIPVAGVDASENAYNHDDYFNRRAELIYDTRDWLEEGGAIPDHDELIQELTEPEYRIKNGKLWVEPKEDLRKASRLGRSPDYMDGLANSITNERRHVFKAESHRVSVDDMMTKLGMTNTAPAARGKVIRISNQDIISGRVGNG